ncbi:MAG TPA: TRAP transporter substrate-binding protein DctP, partial [Spirochaetota bacterium]|nr:TRAP transporter substrate-binding protein DctP [Spirochaetota bacterium]
LLSLSETGWAYFFSKQHVKDIDDIRNTRMWLWEGDRLAYSIMKNFKIKARSIKFTEVIPSFQTGMIDGFYCTPTAAIQLQWYKQVEYMLRLKLSDVTGGLVFSKSSWDNLSSSQQKLVTAIARKELAALTEANRRSDRESIALLKQNGIKIVEPQQDMTAFRRMSEAVARDLQGTLFPASLYNKLKKLLHTYRQKQ